MLFVLRARVIRVRSFHLSPRSRIRYHVEVAIALFRVVKNHNLPIWSALYVRGDMWSPCRCPLNDDVTWEDRHLLLPEIYGIVPVRIEPRQRVIQHIGVAVP